jgi:hypothetical protein
MFVKIQQIVVVEDIYSDATSFLCKEKKQKKRNFYWDAIYLSWSIRH